MYRSSLNCRRAALLAGWRGSLAALCGLAWVAGANAADWTHLGGDAQRSGTAAAGPASLRHVKWIAPAAGDEQFVHNSAPVAHAGLVLVNARHFDADDLHDGNRLVAFDAASGQRRWSAVLDADVFESSAGAAIAPAAGVAVIGSGVAVHGVNLADGSSAWRTPLLHGVVNATPAISADLGSGGAPANRAFITDFAFGNANLYALNIDPFDAVHNPFQPGEIVWSAPLPSASGNSPAYANGRVYVALASGALRAYDAVAGGAPLWNLDSPQPFFGGITTQGSHVFAATYNFSGGQNNSLLYKVDAASGALAWATAAERSSAIPVVAGTRIYLSAGVDGFGSFPKLQAFDDLGGSATLAWDTVIRAPAPPLGSWDFQPALVGGRLYVGTPPAGGAAAPNTHLTIIDVTRPPADPGFVVDTHGGAGGSPALLAGDLYSLGADGLVAFAATADGDVNCDAAFNNFDIDPFVLALLDAAAYAGAYPGCDILHADVDGDGFVTNFDIDPFVARLVGR